MRELDNRNPAVHGGSIKNTYSFRIGKSALKVKPGDVEHTIRVRFYRGVAVYASLEDAKARKSITSAAGLKRRQKLYFDGFGGLSVGTARKHKDGTWSLVSGRCRGPLVFAQDDRKCWVLAMLWMDADRKTRKEKTNAEE